jgi:hypothetical protein
MKSSLVSWLPAINLANKPMPLINDEFVTMAHTNSCITTFATRFNIKAG